MGFLQQINTRQQDFCLKMDSYKATTSLIGQQFK